MSSAPGPDKTESQETKAPAIPIPQEVLEKLPPKQRQQIESFMATAMSIGPMPNPLANKITAEHITEFIKMHSKGMDLQHSDSRDSRRITLIVFAIGSVLSTLVILSLSYANKTDILMELIKAGIFMIGGFGGGYGFSEWKRRKND